MRWQSYRVGILVVVALAMAACGGGSSSPPPVAPTVTLTSSATDVGVPGPAITLSWSSTYATSCTASEAWSGSLALSGSQSIVVPQTSTYTISCSGRGGVATASVTVRAWRPPVASIVADRTEVLRNETVLLTWSSQNATECKGFVGLPGTMPAIPTSGSQVTAPLTETTRFQIICGNPVFGAGIAEVVVTVKMPKFAALELPIESVVDLNDAGDVLGYRTSGDGKLEPVVLIAGGNVEVLGCSGPLPYFCHSHYPVAMNSTRNVIGKRWTLSGMTWDGFLWHAGDSVVHSVPIGFPMDITDINDADQIVGGGPGPGALLYSGGTVVQLFGSNGSVSMASAINNAGHVTGYSVPGNDGIRHVFLYAGGTTQDLGTMGGASSDAQDINLADEIVGVAVVSLDGGMFGRAFLYAHSRFTDLGTLGGARSAAHGINDPGQIVGSSTTPAGEAAAKAHAFLYVDGRMHDLNDLIEPLPVTLVSASKINNRGQVLAYGCVPPSDENCRFYLLTPVSPL